jgi:small subunit ribosomal protein S11
MTEEKIEENKEEIVDQMGEIEEAKKAKGENEEETKVEEKKERKKERVGIAYIYTSFNNTILHITDMAGNTISRITGGMTTKHDRLKANPTIAMFVAKQAAEKAKDQGITSLYVRIKAQTGSTAPGPGAHAAVKSLSREGIKIISISDTTKTPRGGPKGPHGRRGRRV